MANENKKNYSMLDIYTCVNPSKGTTFNLVIADGVLRNLKPCQNTNDGSWFLSGQLPINNRTATINKALNANFDVNVETLWADVTFTDKAATGIDEIRKDRDWLPIRCLQGSINLADYTDRNGNPGKRVRIFVTKFKVDFDLMNKMDARKAGNAGNEQMQNPAPAQNNSGYAPNNRGNAPSYGNNNYGSAPAQAPSGGNNGYNAAPAQQAQNNNRNGGYQPNGNAPGYRGNSGNSGNQVNYQPPGSVAQTGQFVTMDDDDGELPF